MFINEVPNDADITALIITELRDFYGIKYKKEKKHRHSLLKTSHKIFNVHLKDLDYSDVMLSNGNLCRVPTFLVNICDRILQDVEIEGLFRKAGSAARQREIRERLKAGYSLDKTFNAVDLANILKYFFRELPEALMPPGYFQETILRCLLIECSKEHKASVIQMVCLLLSSAHLNTLIYFMQFLNEISRHSDSNKMSVQNLAIVFAPNLMPLSDGSGQRLTSHVQIIEILIENAYNIGVIPFSIQKHIECASNSSAESKNGFSTSQSGKQKRKKRRSGSINRMFTGLRKIVGAFGSTENIEESNEPLLKSTPCLNKKRKVTEQRGFSSKKKKMVVSMLPNADILPPTPIHSTKKTTSTHVESVKQNMHPPQMTNTRTNDTPQQQQQPVPTVLMEDKTKNSKENATFRKNLFNSSPAKNHDKNDVVEISKSEYEEIKQRVSAIETRLTQEFSKFEALANNSLDYHSPNDSRILNGPEKVLSRYERTLEETDFMNSSPSTELAQELSRGLNIRRKPEQKIFRSPSARKISKIRRSLENVPLKRNKSWHFSSRNQVASLNKSPLKELKSFVTPTRVPSIEKIKPLEGNAVVNKPILSASDFLNSLSTKKNIQAQEPQVRNEDWISADTFFKYSASNSKDNVDALTLQSVSKKARISLNKLESDNVMASPMVASTSTSHTTPQKLENFADKHLQTPMLPPRVPIARKTPNACNSSSKTPHSVLSVHKSKQHLTPLWQQEQQQIAGRASIARLRHQNAGMVRAKAKLFNELDKAPSHKIALPAIKTEMHNILNTQKHKSPNALSARGNRNNHDGMQYRRNSRLSKHIGTPEGMRRTAIDTTPSNKQNLMSKQPRRIVRVHNR